MKAINKSIKNISSAIVACATSIFLLSVSICVYGQHYVDYNDQQSQSVIAGDLLKSNDTTLPVQGTGNVILTVFYDYNCPASRELLKLLYQRYVTTSGANTPSPSPSPSVAVPSNVKIVYRPMDYGFNSKDVLQSVLYLKNMNPSKFDQINQEIFKIDSPITLAHLQGMAQRLGIDFKSLMDIKGDDLAKIQNEINKNKQDFEALPFPDVMGSQFKNAIPVIILSKASAPKKLIYFIGSDQYSLDTAISSISKA